MVYLDKSNSTRQRNSKILAGLFIITFGIIHLFERQGAPIAEWVISWKTILIAVGIVVLYKHNFRHFFGYALIGVGGAFLINEIYPHTLNTKLVFPIMIILFGVSMIVKSMNLFQAKSKPHNTTFFDSDKEISSEDYIKASTFFGGITKNVVSKNFKGGEFTTAFGGTEINLTKADIQQPVTIKATTAFGGVTLIVPSNWQVKSEMTTIFGGIEDQRSLPSDITYDPNKTVTLTGSCFFGGVEIQSYV